MSLRGRFVAAAAIALALASGACGSSTPSSPSTTGGGSGNTGGSGNAVMVSVVSGAARLTATAYSPDSITVPVGGTVTWVNNDSVGHTSTANNNSFNVSLPAGGSGSATFNTAGAFPYFCLIHPGMVGTVNVQ